MDEDPEQQALFQLEGPDEDGCVWPCSPDGRDIWYQNLGPTEKVAEVSGSDRSTMTSRSPGCATSKAIGARLEPLWHIDPECERECRHNEDRQQIRSRRLACPVGGWTGLKSGISIPPQTADPASGFRSWGLTQVSENPRLRPSIAWSRVFWSVCPTCPQAPSLKILHSPLVSLVEQNSIVRSAMLDLAR